MPARLSGDHIGDAVEHVRLYASGVRFGEDLCGGGAFVGAGELQLDPRIFFFERLLQRPDRLIDDQVRIPDDLPLLFGRLDQRVIGSPGLAACQQRGEGQQRNRGQPVNRHERSQAGQAALAIRRLA